MTTGNEARASLTAELERYEAEYGMPSAKFYEEFSAGRIESDDEELHRWRAVYAAWRNLDAQTDTVTDVAIRELYIAMENVLSFWDNPDDAEYDDA